MPENDRLAAMPGFLAHGGEMGAIVSTHNWSDTSLGEPEGWPDSLKCVLATILGSTRPMYVLWGPELLFLFNDAYAPMLGRHLNGAMGRPFAQVWPELWADFEPMLRGALAGQGSSYENMPLTLMRHGYPELTWWTFAYLPLHDGAGAVVGVHCIATETTQEVQAQQSLLDKQKQQAFRVELTDALRETTTPEALMAVAAQKLGQYLKASCVGYGEMDAQSQYCVVHQDWTAKGFCSVVGKHRLDNFAVLRAEQLCAGRTVAVHDIDQDVLTTRGAPQVSNQPMRHKALMGAPLVKDGRFSALLFVLNAEARVWTDSEQALVEEVAERTWSALQRLKAELELRESNQALDQRTTELLHSENALRQSQKLEALGQLTGGVAHDFNNLLAVISASVELLKRGQLPSHSHGQYLDRISDTVNRATKLTGQLLAFARQQPLKPELFDVDLHVKSVLDLVRSLMGGHVKIVHKPSGANACLAQADVNQFETALVNLAVNARDAMDAQGRITVQVQAVDCVPAGPARAERAGAFIAISVSDTGCGIAPDRLDAIFEPFCTTKEVGKGTSLGLSQVFGFAKQSGGEIQVSSELGAGAVFTLYLARADSVPLPVASPAGLDAHVQGPASAGGVLVVEDNEILGKMTCEILNALGYRAVWAANVAAALDLMARHSGDFELVFSDVVMPGMNGIELGMEVRRHYPGLPVVLTSGYNAVMAQEGPHGFELIVKPYTADTLARVFRKATAQPAPSPAPSSVGLAV